ncbi:MAG TPA: NifB/NifX family molybdenum-iron cluster-binding protein [Rhizomicrobium sp.]
MDAPHLRIAVASDSLIHLDANFAAAKQMVFYDVARGASEFVDVVHFRRGAGKGPGGGAGPANGCCMTDDMQDDGGAGRDPTTERIEALKGCSVLFTLGISEVAAVRVHNMRIFPVASERARTIDDVIANLQRMMNGAPPLWLRRVMRDGNGNRLGLDDQEI